MASNKLKGKIAEAGYSQRSLALELGMSKNTLNSKVNGKIPFYIDIKSAVVVGDRDRSDCVGQRDQTDKDIAAHGSPRFTCCEVPR